MKTAKNNKDLILDLFKKTHLLKANEIVEMLQSKMDRATVYRNLNKLVEKSVLKELHLEKGMSTYELSNHDHQHFICKNCEKVLSIDIDSSKLSKLIDNVQFHAEDIELNVSGVCSDCK